MKKPARGGFGFSLVLGLVLFAAEDGPNEPYNFVDGTAYKARWPALVAIVRPGITTIRLMIKPAPARPAKDHIPSLMLSRQGNGAFLFAFYPTGIGAPPPIDCIDQ